jgi:hypothetical protein
MKVYLGSLMSATPSTPSRIASARGPSNPARLFWGSAVSQWVWKLCLSACVRIYACMCVCVCVCVCVVCGVLIFLLSGHT